MARQRLQTSPPLDVPVRGQSDSPAPHQLPLVGEQRDCLEG